MPQPLVRRLAAVTGHVVVTRETSSAQEVEDNINDPSSDGKIKKESQPRPSWPAPALPRRAQDRPLNRPDARVLPQKLSERSQPPYHPSPRAPPPPARTPLPLSPPFPMFIAEIGSMSSE